MYGHPFSRPHPGYGLPIRVEDVAVVLGYYLHGTILVGPHFRSSSCCCSPLTISLVLRTGVGWFIVATLGRGGDGNVEQRTDNYCRKRSVVCRVDAYDA
jgi:hypothetical protein